MIVASNFSLYERARSDARSAGLDLRDLGTVETLGPLREQHARFTTRVHGMHQWCRLTEHLVIDRDLRDAEVWAGFQRFSRVAPVLKRYRALDDVVQSLTIFGEQDASLPLARARLVAIDSRASLAAEWFLVVRSSRHQTIIVARDLDGFGTRPLAARRFHAVASHHPTLVDSACAALNAALTS